MLKWMIVNVTLPIIIAEISYFMCYFYNNLNTLNNYVVVFEFGVGVLLINSVDETYIIKIILVKVLVKVLNP
jgi:hypothetical protein